MKTIYLCLFVFLFYTHSSFGQDAGTSKSTAPASQVIQGPAINSIFHKDLKTTLGIKYPIRKGYFNSDKSGASYVLITESFDGLAGNDTVSKNIQILRIAKNGNQFIKTGEINDRISDEDETSIWVWSRFCEFKDADQDGLIDPILIYGTGSSGSISTGRLKIVIWYKDKKTVIRHQNASLDDERNTHVDPAFYTLPLVLQKRVRQIMTRINKDTGIIFPWGWEKKMDQKKLTIAEAGS